MNLGSSLDLSTWGRHLFLFYKEKVFRKLIPVMLVIACYAVLVILLDRYVAFFIRIENSNLGQFHLIFSFILGIVISFRVNTAYSRWWEGRVLWGSIVNNCRNLGLKFEVFVSFAKYPEFYRYLCAFPLILKLYLRRDSAAIAREYATLGLDASRVGHPVLYLVQQMYTLANQLRARNEIRFEQYSALDLHLLNLIDLTGGCERINNTPVPPAFGFFVKQGLLFYSIVFPFGWVDKFGFFVVPMMLVIVYILLGLEILAEELEEPFGTDDNDLPLDAIIKNVVNNVTSIAEQQR